MGNDGGDEVCDVGAYELQLPASGAFCPVDVAGVGYLRTDAIGTGQGSPSKGYRTRKLVIPNYTEVDSLYGQLAATDIGVMKYVRFRYPDGTKEQIYAPTSLAYQPYAISWWGSELDTGYKYVKGQFFWGTKGNKSPRAFVLWPTYNTDEAYANVFATFDESSENHVSWEPNFIPSQQQTVEIPEVQANGATVNVTVALADVNKDGRSVVLNVEAGNVSEERVVTVPNLKDSLNLEEFVLEGVEAGTDQVVITLTLPVPGLDFPSGGDSAAMIGAAVNYECGEVEDAAGAGGARQCVEQPIGRQRRLLEPHPAAAGAADSRGRATGRRGKRPLVVAVEPDFRRTAASTRPIGTPTSSSKNGRHSAE